MTAIAVTVKLAAGLVLAGVILATLATAEATPETGADAKTVAEAAPLSARLCLFPLL